jgi:hypothetical protein
MVRIMRQRIDRKHPARMNRRACLLTAGASVLGAAAVASTGSRGSSAPAVLRRGSLAGETVNVLDYCSANGRGSDAAALQALIDRNPDVLIYPARCRLVLDRPVHLQSHQTHRFEPGAAMTSETPGFAMRAIGETSATLGNVVEAISRYSNRIVLDRQADLAVGDAIILADVADPADIKTDVNVVKAIAGSAIGTAYPIGRAFSDLANLRIYHLYRPIRHLAFEGLFKAENLHQEGGVLQIVNSRDLRLQGIDVLRAGHIGIAVENSIEGSLAQIAVASTGASGLGLRSSKSFRLNGFVAAGVRGDESLTFYENVSLVEVAAVRIRQYLHGQDPGGGVAGNNVLIDRFCSRIRLSDLDCAGSATYNIMVHNHSDDCEIRNFRLAKANLGGIRISAHSHRTRVEAGSISQAVDSFDQERRRPAAPIAIGESCRGTVLGSDIDTGAASVARSVDRWADVLNSR